VEVRAVLDELQIPLKQVLELKEGDTIFLNATPESSVELRSGGIRLTHGHMGRRGHSIAVRVAAPLSTHAALALQERHR
jgi:flagellar motor switch protein FliM